MNPDSSISLTNIDTTILSFENIKKYIKIEQAIQQIDSSIRSPLNSYSDELTPAEITKWSNSVKEKIEEINQTEKWSCKICKETYSLDIDCCVNHTRMTKKLYFMLKDKQLKKNLRLLG